MSRYFQTLKKLQQRRSDEIPEGPAPALKPAADSAREREWPAADPAEVFPELPLAGREAAWSDMIESLRAQAHSTRPSVVVAGVTDAESTRRLVHGLTKQARLRGITVQIARLTASASGRHLSLTTELEASRSRTDRADVEGGAAALGSRRPESLDLSRLEDGLGLAQWLQSVSAEADLLVIEAPGVLSSADTLLLAKASDGLAIVVEPLITDRKALKAAVNRAQASGCRLVGLIVSGHREWLPRWLRRLLPE